MPSQSRTINGSIKKKHQPVKNLYRGAQVGKVGGKHFILSKDPSLNFVFLCFWYAYLHPPLYLLPSSLPPSHVQTNE